MDTCLQDLRYAARALRRSLVFSLSTTLTLGLGIGVVTGFFAIVDAVLLTPLAPHGDSLVRIWKLDPERSIDRFPLSYPELRLWREGSHSFHSLAAISYADRATTAMFVEGEPVPVSMTPVSADFFSVLHGGAPLVGRWLAASDDGNVTELATVVSEPFWRRFGNGDPSFVGRRLSWPGSERALVVVGVAPSTLNYPHETDLWVPIDGYFKADSGNANLDVRSRRFANFHFLGRLRPGVTIEHAREELDVINRRMVAQFPDDLRAMSVAVEPLVNASLGTLRPLTWFLFAGAALVFLAAGGNVAALLVMRGSMQARDLAVRVALGAGQLRLARQTLAESMLLAAGGALLGLLVAQLCLALGQSVVGAAIPRLENATINAHVLAFAMVTALAWVMTLGATPLWRRRRFEAGQLTRHLASRTTRAAGMLRLMIVAQVTAAVIIATAAGLLVRSFVHLRAIDRGVDVSNLAVVKLLLPNTQYPSAAARQAFYARLLPTVAALPGVTSATTVHLAPGTGQTGLSARMMFEGQQPDEARKNPYGTWEPIMPSYFDTLGIPITQGRAFTDADDGDARPVAIVSESVAERYWPGQNPIGKRVQFTSQFPWATVVGVAADTRYRELTRDWLTVYFPAKQFFFFSPDVLVVRSAADPAALLPSLRRAIHAQEPGAAVHSMQTMDKLMSAEIARPRTAVAIATLFALLAIVVAAIGVYAVFSYEMTHRARELAVHAAVGASPAQILGATLRQSLALGAGGTILGLVAAAMVTRLIRLLLFEVTHLDIISYVVAGVGVLLIVMLAALLPARRAARVDPSLLLRSE